MYLPSDGAWSQQFTLKWFWKKNSPNHTCNFSLRFCKINLFFKVFIGNSLTVQWLGLGAFRAKNTGSVPGWGTKTLQASWHGQKKKKFFFKALIQWIVLHLCHFLHRKGEMLCQRAYAFLIVMTITPIPLHGGLINYRHSHHREWTSLVAQTVKNPPAMPETWVQFLGWEDPLEEGMITTPVFLPGDSPWTEEPGGLQSMG